MVGSPVVLTACAAYLGFPLSGTMMFIAVPGCEHSWGNRCSYVHDGINLSTGRVRRRWLISLSRSQAAKYGCDAGPLKASAFKAGSD